MCGITTSLGDKDLAESIQWSLKKIKSLSHINTNMTKFKERKKKTDVNKLEDLSS